MTPRLVGPLMIGLAVLVAACNDSTPPVVLTPDHINVVSGDNQQGTVGQPLPQPIVARVEDAAGNPVPNHVVNFVVVSGGGSLAAPATQTNGDGVVQQLWTLGTSTADSQVVEARVTIAGASAPITARFRALPQAGPAANLTITQGSSQSAYASSAVPVAPAVRLTDAHGNPVSGVAVTFAVGQGGGSVANPTTTSNASGVATAGSWTLGAGSGTNTLTASASGLAAVTFTASAVAVLRAAQLTVGGPPCALTSDGKAYCWGYDDIGSQSTGSTMRMQTAALVSDVLVFSAIDAGDDHVCGIAQGGAAYCWGANTFGQLGNGTTTASTMPVAVSGGLTFRSISAGSSTTCGVTTSNAAYCWGSNGSVSFRAGKLGNGTAGDRTTPTAVAGGLAFSEISTNGQHSCALTATGSAYCWGDNFYAQLGITYTGIMSYDTPQAVIGGLTFARVSLGSQHSCSLDAAGFAYCWGRNHLGQRGDGTSSPSGVASPTLVAGQRAYVQLDANANATCALSPSGEIFCWGSPGFHPFGSTPSSLTQWLGASYFALGARAVGTGHPSCMIAPTDIVYCWSTTMDAVRIP